MFPNGKKMKKFKIIMKGQRNSGSNNLKNILKMKIWVFQKELYKNLQKNYVLNTVKGNKNKVQYLILLFIYHYFEFYYHNSKLCTTRFPYQMMFVSFYSNVTEVISGAGTAYPSWAPEFTTSV